MIKEYLEDRFKQGRLYNSWLIDVDDTAKALENLLIFIESSLFVGKVPLKNHPDYRLVVRDNSGITNVKDISIDQIRDLQQFFYKTPSISKYRVAVIYQADLMNLNAANSCLKLLEDTPKDSFIFLITSRAAGIISTIRSRCAKINIKSQNRLVGSEIYVKFITYIANCSDPKVRLNIIEEFTSKNKELWGDFACSMLYLVNRITKKSLNINIEFNELEDKIFNQLPSNSPDCLVTKFANIKRIINNTIDYDLDLRTSTIELIEELT
ncbi:MULTISPECIES: DNA polymerase III subunit delta' [unclassified Candidatus Tisiphia]|uniref:DNA polymerase III subunit delta' n=1 Tax=unclassified Candidatus Tisiphia TaxID=2996318 RepID=UPI00312C830C